MTWTCAAIDHGLTIYPFGKIAPCCQIDGSYVKPLSLINDPNRFADLKLGHPPPQCHICTFEEANNQTSYRQFLNSACRNNPGLQFLDIRNTNLCNLKCRYCGPHFSSQWAKELKLNQELLHVDLDLDTLLVPSLTDLYFTGGEPLINGDHWRILERVIELGFAAQIRLRYNTNLTTIKYKDKDIQSIWSHFKEVQVNVSIDAIGKPLEYIRSGADWQQIEKNLDVLRNMRKAQIMLTPVVSILNVWFLEDFINWAIERSLKVDPIMLNGPDYLSVGVIPDSFKNLALEQLDSVLAKVKAAESANWQTIRRQIENNDKQHLFLHCLSHILLLDQTRDEKLFALLPFGDEAQKMLLINHEFE
jgi:sulfatase maturation enzyme AslB (radical SAM superfamily)